MNSIFWFLFYIEIWCTIHAFEVKLETGLIFNAKYQTLDEVNEKNGEKLCSSCMVACPATSEREAQINEHVSVSKNSVFVRNTYHEMEQAVDIRADVCEKSFKPSIIFDKITNTHEIGYEMYYRDYGKNLEYKKYDDLKKVIEDTDETPKNLPFTKIDDMREMITKDGYDDKKIQVFNATKFEFLYGRSLVFYWLSVLSFKFNPTQYQIRAYLRADIVNDDNKKMECDNYKLGYDLYTSKNKIYPFSSEVYGSIMQTPLAPMMFFHTKAAKLTTCTRFNSVPVWSHVNKRLNLIDYYLYALYRRFNPNINMIFGVSGMQVKKVRILDDENNLPVDDTAEKDLIMPEIIYRVVEYGLPTPPTTLKHYLIIIIHNERNGVTRDKRLCSEDEIKRLDFSWNESKENGIVSYACAPGLKIFKDLGVFEEPPTKSISTLNLFEFITKFDEVEGFDREDIRDDIEKYASKLFKESTKD